MHQNSLSLMAEFIQAYELKNRTGSVLDVGSYDVNGTYKPLWQGWDYLGIDVAAGPNVDRVIPTSGIWDLQRLFDVVISGQTLEHCRNPFTLSSTMAKHVKPGGLVCWIAPAQWPEHRHPEDCWRILPDGMRQLLETSGMEVLQVGMCRANEPHLDGYDCFGVGRKRE